MRRLSKKLHSSAGASIVVALVLFVLVMMVGVVILTAASANLSWIHERENSQNQYQAVKSAALLLRDELSGMTVTGTQQYVKRDYYQEGISYDVNEPMVIDASADGSWDAASGFASLPERLFSTACGTLAVDGSTGAKTVTPQKAEKTCTLTLRDHDNTPVSAATSVQAEMTLEYNLTKRTMTLTVLLRPMENGSAVDSNVMMLTVTATVEVTTETEKSWIGDYYDDAGTYLGSDWEYTYTHRTTSKWGNGTIEKEEAPEL